MSQEKINIPQEILDWRIITHEPGRINESIQALMDKIVTAVSQHQDLIEEKKKEITKTQEEGNKIHGTNINLTEGKLTLQALIELASDLGLITEGEKRDLYYGGPIAEDEVKQASGLE